MLPMVPMVMTMIIKGVAILMMEMAKAMQGMKVKVMNLKTQFYLHTTTTRSEDSLSY